MKSISHKLISILALFAALLLCTGCVRSGVGIVINSDDTGTVELSVGINEKYIDKLTEQFGEAEMLDDAPTTKIVDGDNTYICTTETKTFKSLDELQKILLELEYDFSAIEGEDDSEEEADDGYVDWLDEPTEPEAIEDYHIFKSAEIAHSAGFFADSYHFSAITQAHEMEEGTDLIPIDSGDMLRLVVTIRMPGTLSTPNGEVSEDGVKFVLTDIEKEVTLTADSQTTNVTGIIIVGVAVIIVIAMIVFLLGRKKPAQHNEFVEVRR